MSNPSLLSAKDITLAVLQIQENLYSDLNINEKEREYPTNLKLQKMLYFIYAIYYYKTNKKLFIENFEAWKYGPVIRELYEFFKEKGVNREEITPNKFKSMCDFQENMIWKKIKDFNINLNLLKEIINSVNTHSTSELINFSHTYGPWRFTEQNGIIDNDKIKEFGKQCQI